MNMKLSFLVCVLLSVFSTCLSDRNAECRQLNNLTTDEINKITRIPEIKDLPMKYKCYAKCLMQELFTDNGKLDLERTTNSIWESQRTVLEKCEEELKNMTTSSDDESCNYAIHILLCMSARNSA